VKDNVSIYHLTKSLFKIIDVLVTSILLKSCDKIWLALDRAHHTNKDSLISKQIKGADEVNKKLSATSSYTGILSYSTHAQAVYTSRLLDFKNLPEPKNADDNNAVYSGN